MLRYKQKKRKKFLYKTILFGIYLIIVLFVFLFNDMGYIQEQKIAKQNNKLEKEIKEKIELLNLLEKEKNKLEEDIEYIEKIAREEFKMTKKEEKVFTIIHNQPKKENK